MWGLNFLQCSNHLTSLIYVLNTFQIRPTINTPTRRLNCLDNICVNLDENLYRSSVVISNISDHQNAQILNIYGQCNKSASTYTYLWRDIHNA